MVLQFLVPALASLAPGVIATGAQARGGPLAPGFDRAPGLQPGDILSVALQTQAMSEAGLSPVVSTDPFTGNVVISTLDQAEGLFNLLGEKFAREALAPGPAESAQVFAEREAFIESRRLTPAFPVPPVTEAREQVVALLTRVSPSVIAPGVVSSARPAAMSRRLAGPCAGPTTGFERLNCARGGIS